MDGAYFNKVIHKAAATMIFSVLLFSAAKHYCQAVGRSEDCIAEGSVRLDGFNSTTAGYLQLCKNGTWMKLLTGINMWTHKNSIVVCQQLGHLGALWLSSKVQLTGSLSMNTTYRASVECTGTEQTLSSCSRNPRSSLVGQQFIFVACREAPSRGDIRLVGVSSSDDEGLVEIYYPRRAYQWSTVCTNDWDDTEAKIVCKQLGYQTGRSKFYSSSDVSPQHRLPRKRYDNFKCNGKESSLSECFSDGPFPYKCYSESYAGVNCQNNDDSGRIHVPPTAAFLVLVTGVLLVVFVVVALLVKCLIKRLKKKVPPAVDHEHQGDGAPHTHRQRGWNHSLVDGYSPLPNPPPPPSYTDTIQADEAAQTQLLQLSTHSSAMAGQSQNTEVVNEQDTSVESNTNVEE